MESYRDREYNVLVLRCVTPAQYDRMVEWALFLGLQYNQQPWYKICVW